MPKTVPSLFSFLLQCLLNCQHLIKWIKYVNVITHIHQRIITRFEALRQLRQPSWRRLGCLATWYLSLMPSTDFSDTLSDCLTTLASGCFLDSQWVWCPHRLFLLPALVTSFVVVINFSSNLVNLQSTTGAMPMAMLPVRHLVLPLKTNQENSGMVKRIEEMSAHSTSCQLPRILHSGIHFGWEMLLLAEKTLSQKPHSINSRTIERGGWALPR